MRFVPTELISQSLSMSMQNKLRAHAASVGMPTLGRVYCEMTSFLILTIQLSRQTSS